MRHLAADGMAAFFLLHPRAKVLDVRFAYEREAGHFPGDHHVPWYTPDWEPNPGFLDRVLQYITPEDYVLVICRSGHRSCEAAVLLETAGFKHVYNLLGGYEDFQKSGKLIPQQAAAGCFSNTAIQEGLAMNRTEKTMGPAAVRHRWIFGCILAATALMCALPVAAAEDSAQTNLEQWQLRRLNEPTERELAHERKGNVYIYDGLTDREVDQALNAHFDRIEYMMFVGTQKSSSTDAVSNNADSNVEMESPGCM